MTSLLDLDFADEFIDFGPTVQPSPAPQTPQTPSILPSPTTATQTDYGFGVSVGQPAGPLGATYKIPPRPKPGRKPATDEPQTKRKAQNREAQRNFRQRKAQRLTELESEREQRDREHQEEKDQLHLQIHSLNLQVAQLNEQANALKRQLQESQNETKRTADERDYWRSVRESSTVPSLRDSSSHYASRSGSSAPLMATSPAYDLTPRTSVDPSGSISATSCGDCQPEKGNCVCLKAFATSANAPLSPISDIRMQDAETTSSYDEREIDFTTQRPDKRPSVAFITQPSVPDSCGFCTDISNCVCAAEARMSIEQNQRDLEQSSMTDAIPLRRVTSRSDNERTAPGSCSECRKNPRQRQWCRTVSRNAQPHEDTAAVRSQPDRSTSASRFSVGCTQAYHIFENRIPMGPNRMDWTADLETLPPGASRKLHFDHLARNKSDERQSHDAKYTAIEIDSASILTALTRHDRRHSLEKKKDKTLQKTVRFLEELPELAREDDEEAHGRARSRHVSENSIGRILN